jgi:hypothetical protein
LTAPVESACAEVRIALSGFVLVALLRHFKVIGAFLIVLIWNSVIYWAESNTWQTAVATTPSAPLQRPFNHQISQDTLILAGELFFLYLLILNGMSRGFAELAGLINTKKQTVPRLRWVYLWCGVFTVLCGFFGGPPIVISPECGAGILAGGRTGFSSVVAGVLFGFVTFFSPMLKGLPGAAIAPLLMSLGVVAMANTKKIDFQDYKIAWPAFTVLFLIPFAFDIVDGVLFGWFSYLILHLFSGDLYRHTKFIVGFYSEALLMNVFTNGLDKYVPAYWLLAPTSPSPAPTAPAVPDVGVRPTLPSLSAGKLGLTESRRSSQSLVKRDDGSYVVDWKGIRKSLYNEFFLDEVPEEDISESISSIPEVDVSVTAESYSVGLGPAPAPGRLTTVSQHNQYGSALNSGTECDFRATWC